MNNTATAISVMEELQEEHLRISLLMKTIATSGLATDRGMAAINEAKALIQSHMQKEQELVYKPFHKLLEKHPELTELDRRFSEEIEQIMREVNDFFLKYREGSLARSFLQDSARMMAMMRTRMKKEEMILFQRFREIMD